MENSPLSPESGRNGNSNGNGNGSGNANGSGNGNTANQFLSPGQQLIYRSTGTQASLRNGSNSTLPSQHHHLTHNNPTSNSIVSGKEICEKSIFWLPIYKAKSGQIPINTITTKESTFCSITVVIIAKYCLADTQNIIWKVWKSGEHLVMW